jgi:hypothetical protein
MPQIAAVVRGMSRTAALQIAQRIAVSQGVADLRVGKPWRPIRSIRGTASNFAAGMESSTVATSLTLCHPASADLR